MSWVLGTFVFLIVFVSVVSLAITGIFKITHKEDDGEV